MFKFSFSDQRFSTSTLQCAMNHSYFSLSYSFLFSSAESRTELVNSNHSLLPRDMALNAFVTSTCGVEYEADAWSTLDCPANVCSSYMVSRVLNHANIWIWISGYGQHLWILFLLFFLVRCPVIRPCQRACLCSKPQFKGGLQL
jgi:hypothetical protein